MDVEQEVALPNIMDQALRVCKVYVRGYVRMQGLRTRLEFGERLCAPPKHWMLMMC